MNSDSQSADAMLLDAAKFGDINGCASSIRLGADVNVVDHRHYDRTPLILAAIAGHTQLAKFLISKGADVDIEDKVS